MTIAELFGHPTSTSDLDWTSIVQEQHCPFLGRRCYKVRKSDPDTSIGSCSVLHGRADTPTVVCPERLVEHGHVFTDCLHLLMLHEPGNTLHVVSEIQVPGGSVDYFLVSEREDKVVDFAGVEIQALDTTGTVWPARQHFLRQVGLPVAGEADGKARFGINWKMTAKTILMQIHHKLETFENLGKKLALVLQDVLLDYMIREFDFEGISRQSRSGHPLHIHSYGTREEDGGAIRLHMTERRSSDSDGVAKCLALRAEARKGLGDLTKQLQNKIGQDTVFHPAWQARAGRRRMQ